MVAVTGPGGTGVSTAAMALAQSLGDDVRAAGLVLLADLRLHAEQAMLHDVRDVAPGVQELVEAHRGGQPSCEAARGLCFMVPERGYHLLLGIRQARYWPALRPQAFEAAFDTLGRAYRTVVCDVDPDLEGEDACGSIDVEERNVMARTAVTRADAVLAVGSSSLKGVHGLVRVITDLVNHGVDPERIVPVLNRASRSPRTRATLGAALARAGPTGHRRHASPRPSTCPSATSTTTSTTDAGSPRCWATPSPAHWPRSWSEPGTGRHRRRRRPGRADPPGLARRVGRRRGGGDPDGPPADRRARGLAAAGDRAPGPAAGRRAVARHLRRRRPGQAPGPDRRRGRGRGPTTSAAACATFDLADPELVAERAFRNLAGYGPLEPLLADDDVWEIMVNAPDQIFVKRHRGPSGYHDEVFHDDEHVLRTLTKILDDASGAHRKLDPAEGLQDAQLDDGARLHIVHGDVGRGGHVLVNIRKFTGVAVPLARRAGRARHARHAGSPTFLRACVRARLSIVFAGAPGSGKTTLLSCCAAELDPGAAGRRRRGGLRGRRPAAERGQHADPTGPAGPPARSTCAGSWPASCAWRPTSPSSARSATARRCRCCSPCRRG